MNRVRLPDDVVADVVYGLSHTETNGQPRYVNYRDMSVQQLGSIYERLLEREPVLKADGQVQIVPNPYARKDSGSFYTPQDLVDLIVDQTLTPLIQERLDAFEAKATELRSDRRPKSDRRAELSRVDPAEAVLDLKVLDPAMGSGHFLVTAVDYLTDTIADLIEPAPELTEWLTDDDAYQSPLLERVAAIRDAIRQRGEEFGWRVDEAQLSEQAIIRRLVLKRCIYGVDKNPLTVELAKVSLWLHSFTVGAPLSFLDHHLRTGDSLLGLGVLEAHKDFEQLGGLSASSTIAAAEAATAGMLRIEQLSDADLGEVRQSAGLFHQVEQATAKLRGVLDFLCGLRWQTVGMNRRAQTHVNRLLAEALARQPDAAFDLLASGPHAAEGESLAPDKALRELRERWTSARSVAERETFLHWEVAFPGVWRHWQNHRPEGGFDAVIGNPPWEKLKLQEVEWFAPRNSAIASSPTAAARAAAIQRLRNEDHSLVHELDAARARAESLGKLVRKSGHYPLLGKGDIDLSSLFVERAMRLVNPRGIVGLLTPSGIYGGKTAAGFFKTVSTAGRIAAVFDFENKQVFFSDVHASTKFCALIFGGYSRKFDTTACAFFLHDTTSIKDSNRCFSLSQDDFARVNPNTGTAPVFRTRRDAEITRAIYEQHPIFADHSRGDDYKIWPFRYRQGLFHSKDDSHLFRTSDQLRAEGAYPVACNRWRRGPVLYLPLYEGKMVQAYDHRAASIVNRESNLFRPAQTIETTSEEHRNPSFHARPRFWIDKSVREETDKLEYLLTFKEFTATTNVRTMIASMVPKVGCMDTIPVLLPDKNTPSAVEAACFLANLNSFCLDYVARQKVPGTHIKLYMLEQFPIIDPRYYKRRFGRRSASDLIVHHVLRLTYTSHDMSPFARDLGHEGPPFTWDEEDRRHLQARLDALYFHLYGLSQDDADYILSTFPIVQGQDEAEFGHFRTRDLILNYMNALAAGDTESQVVL